MVDALTGARELIDDQLVLVHSAGSDLSLSDLESRGWELAELPTGPWTPREPRLGAARRLVSRTALGRVARHVRHGLFPRPVPDPEQPVRDTALEAVVAELRLDLMLYPTPMRAFEISVPYIAAVHDLEHRLQPEFPEVSADGEFEAREYLFRNLIRSATIVVVDSEEGREDLLELYGRFGATEDRVRVLPFAPPSYLFDAVAAEPVGLVRRRYDLPESYLFYPAQFWPHKNHARLVRAIALVRDRGLETPLVLCGTHEGRIREQAYREVKRLVRELRLTDLVHVLGYVPDRDMPVLYGESVALVMPTCFGPTNIPVLEAWASGCPVLTSDRRGNREQAGNAAVLVDPRSVEQIAAGIERIWTDEELRRVLAERGHARLRAFTPEAYRRRLLGILQEARERIVKSSGPPVSRYSAHRRQAQPPTMDLVTRDEIR